MGEISLQFEVISLIVLVAILVIDLLLVLKRPHVPSFKECIGWVVFYVALALIFAVTLYFLADHQVAGQFIVGWLTEYSLSIDNLFVFIVIMSKFAVPRKYQQEVLMVGIIIALIARAILILLGIAVINSFAWVFYIFAIFLFYTAYKQVQGEEEEEAEDGFVMKKLKKAIRVHDEYDGNKLRTVVNGKKVFTPMLLVFLTIGLTDVMFAFDSIPAILGISQNPFIVFTTNLFALMGLRQLYFLLGGLVDRLVYLHYGLAAILAFIGLKLVIHAAHEAPLWPENSGFGHFVHSIPEIPIWLSLAVIAGSMIIAIIASLLWAPKTNDDKPAAAVEGGEGR
ncbi:tellurium resistance protein TerC [Dermabacter sp. HMSC06F07]|uniref:TerC/Alx family metal homeostasis membrane protein n=1 Tax=Dermabacter TaxID=36739 RepID=UPI0003534D89|nr:MULTISPECIES: TerC/Alx family metal homeostasis membrane protein [Dermabacter]EPH15098.1 TerC family integral membrane protein [Dermabacter sp. HFH0086]MCT1709408.1 TerC/Alx family metal homeostasis membrane protein [Dermabacter hominis]MCT1807658.1 TerC/Alx family metal homeostasis membrane protein [Dermabacter hominis]MDK8804156.1 TerC/Alx family metal homeostasis membrane protein [Dermabacter hominis]MDU4924197.1 TerC/Alx family metal homeostasis membrane protein [Dermabacter sp.]